MANSAARSRPGARLDKGGALHRAVERIDVIQPRRILIGIEQRPRPTFRTGSDAPSGCRSSMPETRLVQAGRSPTSKPGLGWTGSGYCIANPQRPKAARRVCLFAFRAKPRYAPHRPRQDNQTRRPSHHYPEQKCLSRGHSGEFRAKTNSGIPPNDPAGNESTRRLFDKEKNKKDSAADCPQEKDPQCAHSLPSEC